MGLDWRDTQMLAAQAVVPEEVIREGIERDDPFLILAWLIPKRPALETSLSGRLIASLEELLRQKAYAEPGSISRQVPPVVFGTGGHRGEIGVGLTLAHIQAIVTALISLVDQRFSPAERLLHFGAEDPAKIRRRGIVIGHDNRLFNREFSGFAAHLLIEKGFTVRYAGRVASPELSLAVPRLGWAAALNFTPSHNPFRYGGLKLNPTDGGLAGSDLTDPLAEEANRVLESLRAQPWPSQQDLQERISAALEKVEQVDLHGVYLEALEAHPVVRLGELIDELQRLPPEKSLRWVVDPVWGAGVPVYQRLQQRIGAKVLSLIHTEEDPYFGGQSTEPNETTLNDALSLLRADPAPLGVAVRNDPDSDRGLVGDRQGAIKMNKFAPMVMRYLMDLGHSGALITTLPTSHFGPDYAKSQGQRVFITPTGFKNFRGLLQKEATLVAYEESDGITIAGHTLDKDGVLAGLLAVRMVLHYGKPLSELLQEVEARIGSYYYLQDTFAISMPAAQARHKLKNLARIQPGYSVDTGSRIRKVSGVDTRDGYKFILDDGSWLMIRPSGTEPKIRIYAETKQSPEETVRLCSQGRTMALEAMGLA